MKARRGFREYWGVLRRQRLPFLYLLVAALVGILLASYLSLDSTGWLVSGGGLVVVCGLAWMGWGRKGDGPVIASLGLLLYVVTSFAVITLWQGRESPAARIGKSLPETGRVAEVRGIVVSEPAEARSGRRGFFTLKVQEVTVDAISFPVRLPVRVVWLGELPEYGDVVKIRGILERMPPARNPGEFSYADWLSRQGISAQVRMVHERDGTIVETGRGNPLMRWAISVRKWMREVLTQDLDPLSPEAQLIVAMTLGETGPMPQSILDEFRDTGTYHLFSVSGLHVGMVAALLWLLLSAVRVPRKGMILIIIPALFFYALITGWKPPSVRAAVMGAFVLGAVLVDRPVVVLNSLCAAAFFILLGNAQEIFNVGFQLSFVVVATLIVLVPPMQKYAEGPLLRDEFLPRRLYGARDKAQNYGARAVGSALAVSVAAWLGSLLLIWGNFSMVSLSSVPANLVSVPWAFCIMFAAMASLCAGAVAPWVVAILNNANWLLAKGMLLVIHGFSLVPGTALGIGKPEFAAPAASLVVFDCGAGAAMSLQVASRHWWIDVGAFGFPERVLLPYLRERGVNQVDGLIFTHGDARHIGGGMEVLDRVSIGRILFPATTDRSTTRRAFLSALEARGLTGEELQAGTRLELAPQVKCLVLYPPQGIERSLADDKALVLLWEIHGWRVLMTSDAGFFTEMWLLENAREELRADVLIKGNHSRGIGMQAQFLDAVQPTVLIAAAAEHPETERMSPALEALLEDREVVSFRQDRSGAVEVRFFKDRMEVNGFLDKSHYSLPFNASSSDHESP